MASTASIDAFPSSADFVVDQMQAVKFALDIARGMAFLHTLEPLIPRHYLNSRGIMVSWDSWVLWKVEEVLLGQGSGVPLPLP